MLMHTRLSPWTHTAILFYLEETKTGSFWGSFTFDWQENCIVKYIHSFIYLSKVMKGPLRRSDEHLRLLR